MKRVLKWLRKLIFPPAEASTLLKLMPFVLMVVVFLGVVVSGAYAWEYTNSPEFCGTRCHSMPPEYTRYQLSPHARIKCVECHIGREFVGNQFTRKAGDLRHVIATVSKNYEYPLEVKSMRPAREICERCHFPEKFSDDSQRVFLDYGTDVENTLNKTYLLLKTGGGTVREGLGRGIHWHIENQVLFYAEDDDEQVIPYVKVINPEDSIAFEYVDITSDFDPYSVDESQLKEMDCMTCHNRISHNIPQPEEAVDQALERGMISPEIPEIKLKAVELLRASYEDVEQARRRMFDLTTYYEATYPDSYDEHAQNIQQAVTVLQDIYSQSVFPEQKVNWDTHADNLGHQQTPGCFRCHDGKHIKSDGQPIRLECNLCHSIPVQTGPDDLVTHIDISHERQPSTHSNTFWIALHDVAYNPNDENETCSSCHDVTDYDTDNNISFCSNAVCHADDLAFVDFETFKEPDYYEILLDQLPHYPSTLEPITAWEETPSLDTIHRVQEAIECEECHEVLPPVQTPSNEMCIACHGETQDGVFALTAYYEPNPHDGHEGATSCSFCHPNFGPYRSPCGLCHADEALTKIGTSSQ